MTSVANLPGNAALQLDNQLCFALYAANHAMHRLYRQRLKSLGLTYPQYLVMLVLWEQDDLTVSAIGERLFLDSATLTPLLKRLEQAGLLHRQRDRQDERQVRIQLSPAGRDLREQARDVPTSVRSAVACSPAELQSLRAQLHDLRRQLDAAA
ncbi:MAG: MarR family transcriptional regulator [Rhodanobacteraceae bacterium]|nr:MarR family transcriptional regulator [Xanthomonadales bacterium]MCP5479326.1 MarR family transcriptional regulator [Rhodanobacteraceae bacterium]HPF71992.1 MarR family transcriptional regulator [Xanthomonadaceae bacterium]HRX98857.1 MarR family transcriptional regulator [Xanthomonadaceae bacterium]